MSSNLKVLQVIPKLGYGGAETGCYDIAHYLPENNCGSFLISFIILFYKINIVHARSRAPAWSCLIACKLTGRKFVTTFHGTYNFKSKIKKYFKYLKLKKKLLVIFRGINVDYFDPGTKLENDEKKLLKNWNINKDKKIILLPGRLTSWKGQELFLEAVNLVNIELGYEAFYGVILGSDQGRDLYKKKLTALTEQYKMNNQIKFIDHCKDMALAYKVSDIVVSASIEPEAFGRVSVEAQAMQKVIIASNIGGS